MRCLRGVLIIIFALCSPPLFIPATAFANGSKALEFNLNSAPARPDWQYFIQAPEAERERLWLYQTARGKHLRDWSWGWRLGWVRVCGKSQRPFCGTVLKEALFDRALVVRAEAATRIGRLYEGSHRSDVVKLLSAAFRDVRNRRHGKPMFVQTRILYALRQIGGSEALRVGQQLANDHPLVRSYWEKLERTHAD